MATCILSPDPESVRKPLAECVEYEYVDNVHGRLATVTRYKYCHKTKGRGLPNRVNDELRHDWLRGIEE